MNLFENITVEVGIVTRALLFPFLTSQSKESQEECAPFPAAFPLEFLTFIYLYNAQFRFAHLVPGSASIVSHIPRLPFFSLQGCRGHFLDGWAKVSVGLT